MYVGTVGKQSGYLWSAIYHTISALFHTPSSNYSTIPHNVTVSLKMFLSHVQSYNVLEDSDYLQK